MNTPLSLLCRLLDQLIARGLLLGLVVCLFTAPTFAAGQNKGEAKANTLGSFAVVCEKLGVPVA